MRVSGILFIKPAHGRFEPARIAGLECLNHSLGLIAEVQYGGKTSYESFISYINHISPMSHIPSVLNGPPTPEEFQRQLSEFMRQHLQRAGAPPAAEPADTGAPEGPAPQAKADQFEFKYKPREVKDYLDRFVIKQDEAKKVLSVALCDHYHHVRLALEGKESPNYAKQNIALIGPTGVGKTFLIRSAADLIGELSVHGIAAEMRIVYRAVTTPFPPELIAAL